MFKTIGVCILSFLLLLGSWSKTMTVLSFQACQDRIAKTLCENKAVVGSSCAGKCYLKKQLKKTQQAEQQVLKSLGDGFEILNSSISISMPVIISTELTISVTKKPLSVYFFQFTRILVKPPSA